MQMHVHIWGTFWAAIKLLKFLTKLLEEKVSRNLRDFVKYSRTKNAGLNKRT